MAQGYAAYASMKGGMSVLTSYMAKEFSARRIRVNSVAPGATRTRKHRSTSPAAIAKRDGKLTNA
ncbi:SDR family oxidoreductase [Pseudomonas gingeri]|uniref:SDR family oxidoreductase n=1 Tax=Pseudomonas gingeri TaxID=117681 RepID=UPI00351C4551